MCSDNGRNNTIGKLVGDQNWEQCSVTEMKEPISNTIRFLPWATRYTLEPFTDLESVESE